MRAFIAANADKKVVPVEGTGADRAAVGTLVARLHGRVPRWTCWLRGGVGSWNSSFPAIGVSMTTAAQARALEGIVARLERAIGRRCRVTQNERLREKATGTLREFDVVVRADLPSRTFTAVVEVQKRNRRVGVGTLDGWLGKARDVGANRLVCVSQQGFTDPARKKADLQGDFVDLYTLDVCDTWPPDLPRIQVKLGAAIWHVLDRVLIARQQESSDSPRLGPEETRHEAIPATSRVLEINGTNTLLGFDDLLHSAGSTLETHFPNSLHDGVVLDLDFPVTEQQSFLVHSGGVTGKVRKLACRARIQQYVVTPDRYDILRYQKVGEAKASGYVVTPVSEKGFATPQRIDLAVAPPLQAEVMRIVPPPVDGYRHRNNPGEEFGLVSKMPLGPVLRTNIRFYRDGPPQVDLKVLAGAAIASPVRTEENSR
jgi:hypothetical protein